MLLKASAATGEWLSDRYGTDGNDGTVDDDDDEDYGSGRESRP